MKEALNEMFYRLGNPFEYGWFYVALSIALIIGCTNPPSHLLHPIDCMLCVWIGWVTAR